MKSAVLLVCFLHLGSAVIHSWKAYYTGSTGLSEFPEFVAVNIIDDQVMGYFDSNTNRFESRQSWMAGTLGQEYDEQQTNVLRGHVPTFKNNVKVVMERFNETQGVHVVQWYLGCEWNDVTGATKGFSMDGYDGEDFISLDLENSRFIAAVPQAFPTKQKWDADRGQIQYYKTYFSSDCIDWLKKYVEYGSSILGRKIPPKVSMFQKDSSAVVCHATGFYPQGVMITWKRDGKEMTDDIDVGETLPNADGNFQKRAVLNVQLEDRKSSKYTCEVTHSSGEPITMILNEDELKRSDPDSVPLGPIIGVVVGLLVVIAVIAGFVVLRNKKKSGFARANTDESSQSSGEKA